MRLLKCVWTAGRTVRHSITFLSTVVSSRCTQTRLPLQVYCVRTAQDIEMFTSDLYET